LVKKIIKNGLFTVSCLGCGLLAMLHSIDKQETPIMAMNVLCLHAHALADHEARACYHAGWLWIDPLGNLPPSMIQPAHVVIAASATASDDGDLSAVHPPDPCEDK